MRLPFIARTRASATVDDAFVNSDRKDPRGRLIGVLAMLFALATVVLGLGQLQAPSMSPYDEVTHEGYAWAVAHGDVPARGDTLPPVALEDWACQGIDGGGATAACDDGAALSPSEFPNGAQQYNFGHPPAYYALTGAVAMAVQWMVPEAADLPTAFLVSARAISILWIWSGLALLYVALRRWAVDWRIAASAAVIVLLLPTTLHTGTSVTNDAPFVLAGAAALLVLARIYVDRNTSWVLPALLAIAAASTKVLNGWVLLAAALVILLDAIGLRIGETPLRRRPLVAIAFSMVGGVLAVFGAWAVFQSRRGDPAWVNPIGGKHNRPIEGLPLQEWLSTMLSGMNPGYGAYLDPQVVTDPMRLWQSLAMVLLVAGTWVGLLVFSRRRDAQFAVAATAGFGILLYPLMVQLQVFASSGFTNYFDSITTRYGASVIPIVIACWSLAAERRRLVVPAVAVASAALILVLLGLLGLLPTIEH